MALPFEQQARERDKAFAAFSLYLSLGAERSTREVGKQLGKSEGLIERWAAKFDWRSRVAAHAAHLAVVEREAVEVAARSKAAEWASREQKLRETEWAMHERAIAAAEKAFTAFRTGRRCMPTWRTSPACWRSPASWGGWRPGWILTASASEASCRPCGSR